MLLWNSLHELFVLQSAIKNIIALAKKYEIFKIVPIDFFSNKAKFWKMLLSKLLNRKKVPKFL